MTHISFSEFKNWIQCPFYHKLVNIDKIKLFKGNEYTAFGTAIHDTCEKMLLTGSTNVDPGPYFFEKFISSIEDLMIKNVDLNSKLINDLEKQGKNLSPLIMPATKEFFGNYKVVGTEIALYEPMREITSDPDYRFKGYVDAVIKTDDGKYHLIDWKTCSWGWDAKKRSDKILAYQLVFYKHFFAKKHGIDPKNIETYFALLKRTAKKDNVEFFRVTSGDKKTKNALNLLRKSLHNIKKKIHIKNRLSCTRCEFYKTEHCY
tara:strand:+ start:257 stop:1039 length:783 start_codon:yes stop_codon:yes gene_type:complete